MTQKLESIIKKVGRGLGHAAAATIAVPVGFAQWAAEDYRNMDQAKFIESHFSDDNCLKSKMLADLRRREQAQPKLREYIAGWYDSLKPLEYNV